MRLLSKMIRLAYSDVGVREELLPIILSEKVRRAARRHKKAGSAWDQFFGDSSKAGRFRTYLTNDPEGVVRAASAKGAVFEDPNTGLKNSFSTVLRKAELKNEWALSVIQDLYKRFEKYEEDNRDEKRDVEDDLEETMASMKEFLAQSEEDYQAIRKAIDGMDWEGEKLTEDWGLTKKDITDMAVRARGAMTYKSFIKRDGDGLVGFGKRMADGVVFGMASRYERIAILGVGGADAALKGLRGLFSEGGDADQSMIADGIMMFKRWQLMDSLVEQGLTDDEIETRLAVEEGKIRETVDKAIGKKSVKEALGEEIAYQAQRFLFAKLFETVGLGDLVKKEVNQVLTAVQGIPKGEALNYLSDLAMKGLSADKIEKIVAISGMKQIYIRATEKALSAIEGNESAEEAVALFRQFFRDTVDSSKAKAQTVGDVNAKYQTKATAIIKKIEDAKTPQDLVKLSEEMSRLCRDYFSEGLAEIDKTSERYVLTNELGQASDLASGAARKLRDLVVGPKKEPKSQPLTLLDSLVTLDKTAYLHKRGGEDLLDSLTDEKIKSTKSDAVSRVQKSRTKGDEDISIPHRAILLYQAGRMQIINALTLMEVSGKTDELERLIKKDISNIKGSTGKEVKDAFLKAMDEARRKGKKGKK